MSDQQNVAGSWDQENHNPSNNNDNVSRSRNNEEKKTRRVERFRIILLARFAAMRNAIEVMVHTRRTALKQAQRIGRILLHVKRVLGHGNWQRWLAGNIMIDGRQLITDKVARNWMAIARNRDLLETEVNSDSTITQALALIQKRRAENKRQDETSEGVQQTVAELDANAKAAAEKHFYRMLRSGFEILSDSIDSASITELRKIERNLTMLLEAVHRRTATLERGGPE